MKEVCTSRVKDGKRTTKESGIPKGPGPKMAEHRLDHVREHSHMMRWLNRPIFPVDTVEVSLLQCYNWLRRLT